MHDGNVLELRRAILFSATGVYCTANVLQADELTDPFISSPLSIKICPL